MSIQGFNIGGTVQKYDYGSLENKPELGGVTLDGDKSVSLGIDANDDLLYIYIGGTRLGTGIEITQSGYTGHVVLSTQSVSLQEGGTGSFTVALDTEPENNQTVYVVSGNTSKLTVSPGTLTFTPQNYSTAQTVTLTAQADDDADDENVTVTVTLRATSSQVAVTITDPDTPKVTSGLALEWDFRNLQSLSNPVVDTINGVELSAGANSSYFGYVANGIYGSANARYMNADTSNAAWADFLSDMSTANNNGYTIEVFGMRMPGLARGTYGFLATKVSAGYDAQPNATASPGAGPGTTPYTDSNNTSQSVVAWSGSNSVFDNGTSNGYITVAQQDFLQADVVYNNDGTVDCYYNGYKNRSTWTGTSSFSAWDVSTHFSAMGTNFLRASDLGSNPDYYLTFIRVYNRPLSASEVTQNINYNKSSIGISNF